MDNLRELDKLLSNETITSDGWYDYMEEVAKSRAKDLDEPEWVELDNTWKTKAEDWQVRLAGLLGSFNPSRTVPILENMVRSSSPKVRSEALNSLEGMDGEEYLYIPGQEILQRLESIHAEEQNTIQRDTIESLQRRAGQ